MKEEEGEGRGKRAGRKRESYRYCLVCSVCFCFLNLQWMAVYKVNDVC